MNDNVIGHPRSLEEVRAAIARREAARRQWLTWRWWRAEEGKSAFARRLAASGAVAAKPKSALDP